MSKTTYILHNEIKQKQKTKTSLNICFLELPEEFPTNSKNEFEAVNPAGKQHQNDVVSTSMRRDHVASTLIRRHFNVVCPLGR